MPNDRKTAIAQGCRRGLGVASSLPKRQKPVPLGLRCRKSSARLHVEGELISGVADQSFGQKT
jgi:hypothetical protein